MDSGRCFLVRFFHLFCGHPLDFFFKLLRSFLLLVLVLGSLNDLEGVIQLLLVHFFIVNFLRFHYFDLGLHCFECSGYFLDLILFCYGFFQLLLVSIFFDLLYSLLKIGLVHRNAALGFG